jgi:hypothetical protein
MPNGHVRVRYQCDLAGLAVHVDLGQDRTGGVVHHRTYDFELVSQTGFDNYVLHMTMHETVDANGVPTATVDNFSMDCKG